MEKRKHRKDKTPAVHKKTSTKLAPSKTPKETFLPNIEDRRSCRQE